MSRLDWRGGSRSKGAYACLALIGICCRPTRRSGRRARLIACERDAGDTESKVRRCGIVGRGSCFIAARSTNCSVLTREVLMDGCFSQDYVEAREKFTTAARAADAELTGFALDKRGPDGGELS